MKKLILISGLTLILAQYSFPQTKAIKNSISKKSYWSIGFTGGTTAKIFDNTGEPNKSFAGYTAGINLYFNIDKKNSIGAEANYGRFASKEIYNSHGLEKDYTTFFELTFGPRFHIGENYYLSFHLGNYFLTYNYEDEYYSNNKYYPANIRSNTYPGFGASLGAEKIFELSKDFDLTVNGRVSLMLPGMEPILYGILRTGFIFKNGKTVNRDIKYLTPEKTHSLSLSGGITDPDLFYKGYYRITPNLGIEGTLRTSPKIELYTSVTYNEILDDYSYFYNTAYGSITEITAGPRFMIGSQKFAGFVQPGGGLYLYYYRARGGCGGEEMFFGLNAGTGFMITVLSDFSVIFKSRIHIIFDGQIKPGGYINTTGGIRYEL